jgi:transposase-like protein
MMEERSLTVDHTTIYRWVQRYAPELDKRSRPQLRPTNDSYRVDETYVKIKGKWYYLYRALDSTGQTIDFMLSARRDTKAAKRFFRKMLKAPKHQSPRVINVDRNKAYPPAVEELKEEGVLPMGLLILEWSRSRRDLAQITLSVAEWRRKYEERGQAARDLMKEMQASDQQLSAKRDRLAAQSEGRLEHRSRLANGTGKAAAHQAVVPVFALRAMRSDGPDLPRPANRITLPSPPKLIVLLLELGPDTDFQSYRVAVSAANGRSIWRESQLAPSSTDTLALSFNSGLFKSGDYLLTLEGLTTQERYVLIARHTFRVITR